MPEIVAELGKDKTLRLFVQESTIVAELKKNGLYTDDVLPEYVILLLANRHPRDKIMADLDGLLGTEIASAFTTWLFQEVERLKNEEHAAPIQQQIFEQPSQQTPVANPEVPNVEMDRRLPTDNRLFSSALKSATTGSSDSSRRREPGRSDYVPEEGYRTRRNRTPSPEPMNVEESADRSRRHVSRRDNGRRDRSEEDSRGASRRIVKTDGTLKIEVKDARELISRRRRDSKSPDRQQVSRNIGRSAMDVDQQSPNFPPLPILLPLSGTAPEDRPQRIKCPDFPNCKNDPCSYYHPKRVCIHFPNCGKGPACTYIHPPIPCKFQSLCQNPMCNYTHSPELEAAMAPPAPKPSAPPSIMSAGPKSAVICKFHPHCTNSYCPFVHPVEIPCKFGENCTRLGCHFKHPAGHSGAPKSKIFSPCMFGPRCAKIGCPYQHPAQPETSEPTDMVTDQPETNAVPASIDISSPFTEASNTQ